MFPDTTLVYSNRTQADLCPPSRLVSAVLVCGWCAACAVPAPSSACVLRAVRCPAVACRCLVIKGDVVLGRTVLSELDRHPRPGHAQGDLRPGRRHVHFTKLRSGRRQRSLYDQPTLYCPIHLDLSYLPGSLELRLPEPRCRLDARLRSTTAL